VVVEQTHKKLEHWEAEGRPGDYHEVVISAVKEVGGPSFFALLVIAVGFLPVFTWKRRKAASSSRWRLPRTSPWRLRHCWRSRSIPAMRLLFTRMDGFNFRPRWLAKIVNAILVGKIHSEDNHPISRPMMKVYHPVVEFVLDHKWLTICGALLAMALTHPGLFQARIGVHAAAR
jgi:Cu(I)/Ag(I) efflux system membrane protein CusA/SilA